MRIDAAAAVKVGTVDASAVYVGTGQVWPVASGGTAPTITGVTSTRGAGSQTLPIPTFNPDDVLVCVAGGSSGTITPPTGWTLVGDSDNGFAKIAVYKATVPGSAGTGWSCTVQCAYASFAIGPSDGGVEVDLTTGTGTAPVSDALTPTVLAPLSLRAMTANAVTHTEPTGTTAAAGTQNSFVEVRTATDDDNSFEQVLWAMSPSGPWGAATVAIEGA